MDIPKDVYQGAGVLMSYEDDIILGIRLDKDGKETGEIEYIGGWKEDGEIPSQTAFNELVEESGQVILDADWHDRATALYTFVQMWIWCFHVPLTDQEYAHVVQAHKELKKWDPHTTRSFKDITGRDEPARKGIAGFVSVPKKTFVNLVTEFHRMPPTKNRMTDAKKFGQDNRLLVKAVDGVSMPSTYALRGFNAVIFETHSEKIKEIF